MAGNSRASLFFFFSNANSIHAGESYAYVYGFDGGGLFFVLLFVDRLVSQSCTPSHLVIHSTLLFDVKKVQYRSMNSAGSFFVSIRYTFDR